MLGIKKWPYRRLKKLEDRIKLLEKDPNIDHLMIQNCKQEIISIYKKENNQYFEIEKKISKPYNFIAYNANLLSLKKNVNIKKIKETKEICFKNVSENLNKMSISNILNQKEESIDFSRIFNVN
jgi:hypothetical protein